MHDEIDKTTYQPKDGVLITDKNDEDYQQIGEIVGIHEKVSVKLSDKVVDYDFEQLRLTDKFDGRYVVVISEGKFFELEYPSFDSLKPGNIVKLNEARQITGTSEIQMNYGPVCVIDAIGDDYVEVSDKGEAWAVANLDKINLKEGDKVVIDSNHLRVIKKIPKDNSKRYNLTSEPNINWDSIGGLKKPKEMIREFLEIPYQHPKIYSHYNIDRPKGAVFHGPPGCGKTMLARLCAWVLADVHGKEATDTGCLLVKGPEILDKYVGKTEGEIRSFFQRGRDHYHEHGYPGLLIIDEADAILPQRGTRQTSDIADTMVPMFLGEMDGVDEEQTKANPIVILMTNRIDILDPAVIRAGRISHHIKIPRPDEIDAFDILSIHTKDVPFKGDRNKIVSHAVADVFSRSRLLYRINNEHDFVFADVVNGALLRQISERSKILALKRDVENKTQTGVDLIDFRTAVQEAYKEQEGLNHTYDLHDFAERHHLRFESMEVTRCFGAA